MYSIYAAVCSFCQIQVNDFCCVALFRVWQPAAKKPRKEKATTNTNDDGEAVAAPKKRRKKAVVLEDSDEDSDDSEPAPVSLAERVQRARANKPTSYRIDSDSDEDSDAVADQDGSGDDFQVESDASFNPLDSSDSDFGASRVSTVGVGVLFHVQMDGTELIPCVIEQSCSISYLSP